MSLSPFRAVLKMLNDELKEEPRPVNLGGFSVMSRATVQHGRRVSETGAMDFQTSIHLARWGITTASSTLSAV
jgi:hypothetical protein